MTKKQLTTDIEGVLVHYDIPEWRKERLISDLASLVMNHREDAYKKGQRQALQVSDFSEIYQIDTATNDVMQKLADNNYEEWEYDNRDYETIQKAIIRAFKNGKISGMDKEVKDNISLLAITFNASVGKTKDLTLREEEQANRIKQIAKEKRKRLKEKNE